MDREKLLSAIVLKMANAEALRRERASVGNKESANFWSGQYSGLRSAALLIFTPEEMRTLDDRVIRANTRAKEGA